MSSSNVDNNIVGDNSAVQADMVISSTIQKEVQVGGLLQNPYQGFITHPVLLETFTWDGATSTDVPVGIDAYSDYISLAPSSIRKKFSNFNLQRCRFKFTVIVQGSTQSSGQLVYVFAPRVPTVTPSGSASFYADRSNIYNSHLHPHIVVDPSKSATYELDLGMTSDTGVMNASWAVNRHVVNPIRSGTATASTVTVSLYLSLVDVDLDAPTTTVVLTSSAFIKEKEGTKASDIVTNVGRMAAIAGRIAPAISPYTTLFSNVAGSAGDALRALGYSKPPVVDKEYSIVMGIADPPSQVEGTSTATVYGRSQGDTRSIDPASLGGSLDEQKISTLIARPCLAIRDFAILPAAAAGSLLVSIPVTPALSHFAGTVSGLTYPTPLAMMSLLHRWYTGSLEYKFEFVASIFHRATIVIAYDPVPTSPAPPSMADAIATLQHVIVNVSGNTSIDVTIPYKNIDPWTATDGRVINYNLPNVSSTMGFCYVYIMQPVKSSGSTDAIGMNVYTSSKDMVFAFPTLARFSGSFPYKINLTGSRFIVESSAHSFGTNRVDPQEAVSYMTDVSLVLKDLTRRSTFYAGYNGPGNSDDVVLIVQTMPAFPGTVAYAVPISPTFGAIIATGFKGFLGSAEYIFRAINGGDSTYTGILEAARSFDLAPNAVTPPSAALGANYATMGDANASNWSYDSSRFTSYMKINVPLFSNRFFYYTIARWINTRDTVKFYASAGGSATTKTMLYASHGDDSTYVQFLGFPTLFTNLPNP